MIGKLTGKVDVLGEDWVIIDVGGVGYEVACSSRVLAALPGRGEMVTLAIETHVREQEIRLFGFQTEAERQWFRLLQSVQGVGARSALAILSTLTPAELANAVALQDKATVARAPGVGPKVAGRIVSELQGKSPVLAGAGDSGVPGAGAPVPAAEGAVAADAVSALVNLGYPLAHASAAVAAAAKSAGEGARTEDLIRLGLKELAR